MEDLTMETTFDKDKLVELIKKHREEYWNGNPSISDAQYDALIESLRYIDPMHPLLTNVETGGNIKGSEVVHKKPMLSLEKVYSKETLKAWMIKVARSDNEMFLIQPKYDGVSCHFENTRFATRGDGNVGQDITNAYYRFGNIETNLGKEWTGANIYGEIVIKKSVFENKYKNIVNVSGNKFKNPRNAVVGLLSNDDYNFYLKQNAEFTFVDYNLHSYKCSLKDFDFKWNIISQIIEKLDYPMDGIVVKLEDKNYSDYLGFTAHHPKGQIAFKFENVSQWTKLKDVEFGMGKGQITATAIFETININGVSINRAVIPMMSENIPCIMKKHFTKGSKLLVERAGDVIPHIVQVNTDPYAEPFIINKCPFCGEEIEVIGNQVVCTNSLCTERNIQNVYLSLVALGAKNIGIQTVRVIYDMMGIQNFTTKAFIDFVFSSNGREKIVNAAGFGFTSYNNLLRDLMLVKENVEENVIASLNIPNVGKKIGKVLIDKYQTIDSIFVHPAFHSIDELKQLEGIGDVMAERLFKVACNFNHQCYVDEYVKWFTFKTQNNLVSVASGKTICFTGAMRYERKEMQRIAIEKGFNPVPSVTRGLDILVTADVNSTSSKIQKAKRYGTKVISEDDFFNGNY